MPTQKPRDMKQLRNLRYKHLHSTKISKDDIYNLHEIAYDIAGFFWKITTFPDLVCVCGLKELLDEADRVMHIGGDQLLSYDTTFQLGDFYVSPLIFRHIIFKERPCIPAMCLLHERKFTEMHKEMFHECAKNMPSSKKVKIPLVMDREAALMKALQSELPNVALVFCWNHIFKVIRRWLHQHGVPSSDITIYKDDVHKLFHCSSYEEYTNELENCNTRWDGEFIKYYLKEIHPHVPEYIGRWVLEDLHIYNPYSGITNQSESLNFLLIARMERS